MVNDIAILIHHPQWKGLRPAVLRAAEAALTAQKVKKSAVTLVLAGDAQVKTLNRMYRGKNKPTNVLSFTNGAVEAGVRQLGDVILAYETLQKEAMEQGKPLKHHLSHLVVHGVLHLLGHDHEENAQAKRMEAIEIRLLKSMGIANPYESA